MSEGTERVKEIKKGSQSQAELSGKCDFAYDKWQSLNFQLLGTGLSLEDLEQQYDSTVEEKSSNLIWWSKQMITRDEEKDKNVTEC